MFGEFIARTSLQSGYDGFRHRETGVIPIPYNRTDANIYKDNQTRQQPSRVTHDA